MTKGRPPNKKGTVLIRAPEDIIKELDYNFPEISNPDKIRLMYKYSPFKAEVWLKKPLKKNVKKK